MPSTRASMKPLDTRTAIWLLAILTVLAYSGVLTAGFVYEDSPWLPVFTGVSAPGLGALVYAPWTFGRWLNGGSPVGYHAVVIIGHLVNGILFYRIMRAIGLQTGALVALAIFWLHPLNSEAVSYLSAGREVFATCWVLLALTIGSMRGHPILRATLIALCTTVAVLTKASAAPAILLVPFGLVLVSGDKLLLWASRVWLIVVAALVSIPGALYVRSLQASEGTLYIGFTGLFRNMALTSAALCRYLSLVICPVGLSIDHDWARVDPIWTTLAVGAIAGLCAGAWLKRETEPALACGVAWMLLALLPRFVVQQNEILNEHQIYLAFLAVWVLIGYSAERLFSIYAVHGTVNVKEPYAACVSR